MTAAGPDRTEVGDLVAFWTACLDADEAAAGRCRALRDKLDDPRRQIDPGLRDGAEYAWREAAIDPARMLREVAAKRAILAEHPLQADLLAWSLRQPHVQAGRVRPTAWCDRCKVPVPGAQVDEDQHAEVDWPCPTLRHTFAVYRDRPGYRQEWAL